MEMTRRERILAAINHKEPDRIPLDLGVCDACWLTKPFYLKLLDYLGWKEDNIELTNEVSQTVKLSERMRSFLNVDIVEPHSRFCIFRGIAQQHRAFIGVNGNFCPCCIRRTLADRNGQSLIHELGRSQIAHQKTSPPLI